MPTVNCPYFALWMSALFDKTIKMILPQVNKVHRFDNKRVSKTNSCSSFGDNHLFIGLKISTNPVGVSYQIRQTPGAYREQRLDTEWVS